MSQVSAESEFHFQNVILSIPERGIEVDISQTIVELTLYESVNIPYITGNMVCVDTEFAFEQLKMTGTERLELVIMAQEYDYTFKKKFIITRTVGKTKMDEKGYAYNFYIAEEIFFIDVCNLPLTSILPLLSFLIPTFERFNPSVYGFLPTETKTLSTSIFSSLPVLVSV